MRPGKKRRRTRAGKGIYKNGYGLLATVKVGTGAESAQRSKLFPLDTVHQVMREWQDAMRQELRTVAGRPGISRW